MFVRTTFTGPVTPIPGTTNFIDAGVTAKTNVRASFTVTRVSASKAGPPTTFASVTVSPGDAAVGLTPPGNGAGFTITCFVPLMPPLGAPVTVNVTVTTPGERAFIVPNDTRFPTVESLVENVGARTPVTG